MARSPYTDRQHTEVSLREGASPKGGCEDGVTGFTCLPHSSCAQKLKPIYLGMTVFRLGGGNASPEAGHGCAGARCHRSRPAPGARHRQLPGSEMASQPPGTPSSPEAPGKGRTSQRCHAQPLSVPARHDDSDTARKLKNAMFPGWLSCMTLARACGRFKMSNLEGCQKELLASLDPLALDEELPPPETHSVLQKFWGNQEPLSKVRSAL